MESDPDVQTSESPEELFLYAEAKLGVELEHFLATDIGKYLKSRCEEEVRQYTALTLDPDPDDKALRVAKARAFGARMAMTFIAEAVANGRNSERQLQEIEGD